jgi:hypothetical protein
VARTVAITGRSDGNINSRRTVANRGSGEPPRTPRTLATRSTETRSGSSEGGSRRGTGGRGFGAWKSNVKSNSGGINNFSVKNQKLIIAFLEDEPFDNVFRHWIEYLNDEGKTQRTPKNCIGDDCPLCLRGHEPKPFLLFNVVDLADRTKVQLWEASPEPAKRIEKRYDDLAERNLSLNSAGVYFEVSKAKKNNGFTEYTVDRLRDADLEELKIEPLTDDDVESLGAQLYDSSVIKYESRADLENWAADHMTDDRPDEDYGEEPPF